MQKSGTVNFKLFENRGTTHTQIKIKNILYTILNRKQLKEYILIYRLITKYKLLDVCFGKYFKIFINRMHSIKFFLLKKISFTK